MYKSGIISLKRHQKQLFIDYLKLNIYMSHIWIFFLWKIEKYLLDLDYVIIDYQLKRDDGLIFQEKKEYALYQGCIGDEFHYLF